MTKIKTLTIQFDTPLRRSEIPLFRGAIIAAIPSSNVLFHNHDRTSLRYSYPLIQYKRIGGKAAITCIGKGVDSIGQFFSINKDHKLRIRDKTRTFPIQNLQALQTEIQCWDCSFDYRIRDWLPLNETNYKVYTETTSLIEHIKILEKILVGNILSLAKGLEINITSTIDVSITAIENIRSVRYKRVPLRCMDIQFKSNLSLPDFIGIGKHTSVGFGIITKKNNVKNKYGQH